MRDDQKRNSIVTGSASWRWPWDGGTDLDVGVKSHDDFGGGKAALGGGMVDRPGSKAPPVEALRVPRPRRLYGATSAPGLRSWPVQFVVLVALAYHLLGPGAALITNGEVGARGLLALIQAFIPDIFDFDIARWLIPGAAAWMWQPPLAVGGAALLRLTALNTAKRDPLAAIWIAAAALVVDVATWLFVGLKLTETAFTPDEAHALITLLKVEGGVLLALFFLLAPRGKKKPGQTDD